jgi:magnesium chelatase accessory protein
MSSRFPDWNSEGKGWPNRDLSRFVEADGYRWHVQEARAEPSDAPVCVLIHGTGAATHSWRDIIPLLAQHYRVIAMDLPGHGFTRANHARGVNLPEMARSIAALLAELDVKPDLVVGHSAGAAIGLQLLLQNDWVVPLVGLNPALLPFPGLAAKLFPTLAKMLFTNPFVAIIFSRMASGSGEVERFLRKSTGSVIDREGNEFYRRLFARSGHCDGAIRMMASWRLEDLERQLPDAVLTVMLVHADNDKAIPRSAVKRAAQLIPNCRFESIAGAGHLAHEEQPAQIAALITDFAADARD